MKDTELKDLELSDIPLRLTFGKHKGKLLTDVPASYLIWLFEQDFVQKSYPDIYDYIEANYSEIQDRADYEEYYEDRDIYDDGDIY